VKQLNKLVITVSNFFIFFTFLIFACLNLNSNSGMPHFGPQQNNSAKVYRPDNFNRIYDNRNRLTRLRTAAELATLIVIQKQSNPETTDPDSSLAKIRREREQQAQAQLQAREFFRKQKLASNVIRAYNHRLHNAHKYVGANTQARTNLPGRHQAEMAERCCYAKFNNPEQQWLHSQQLDLICELDDHKAFPKNTIGLQDFSDTVLETVTLAHQANCENLIKISKSFTRLAQDFMAFGRGLVKSGQGFVGNLIQAGSSLILHPINTTRIMGG
jgi:hypothetical protein